jgi:hypothetical protein
VLILLRKSQCASLSVVYRSLLALLAGVTVVGTASARVSQPEPSFVIQGDNKIGYFAVKPDGTLFGAQQAFGDPTSIVRGRYQNCRVGWRSASLSIQFYNLGGEDACEPQYGYLSQAIMAGRQWRTSKGLRIGHPCRYIFRYFPRARPAPAGPWWWLVIRRSPYGDNALYGGLEAKVQRGWVVAFRVNYAAGGD